MPPYQCKICGELRSFTGMVYETELSICCSCADKATNYYFLQHSGKYFNWKQEPQDQPATSPLGAE